MQAALQTAALDLDFSTGDEEENAEPCPRSKTFHIQ